MKEIRSVIGTVPTRNSMRSCTMMNVTDCEMKFKTSECAQRDERNVNVTGNIRIRLLGETVNKNYKKYARMNVKRLDKSTVRNVGERKVLKGNVRSFAGTLKGVNQIMSFQFLAQA